MLVDKESDRIMSTKLILLFWTISIAIFLAFSITLITIFNESTYNTVNFYEKIDPDSKEASVPFPLITFCLSRKHIQNQPLSPDAMKDNEELTLSSVERKIFNDGVNIHTGDKYSDSDYYTTIRVYTHPYESYEVPEIKKPLGKRIEDCHMYKLEYRPNNIHPEWVSSYIEESSNYQLRIERLKYEVDMVIIMHEKPGYMNTFFGNPATSTLMIAGQDLDYRYPMTRKINIQVEATQIVPFAPCDSEKNGKDYNDCFEHKLERDLGCQLRGTEDINDGRFFEEPETSTDPFNSGIFAKRTSNKPRPARTCSTHEDLKKLLELYPDERKETEESMRKLLANESCLPACTKFVYEPFIVSEQIVKSTGKYPSDYVELLVTLANPKIKERNRDSFVTKKNYKDAIFTIFLAVMFHLTFLTLILKFYGPIYLKDNESNKMKPQQPKKFRLIKKSN